MRPRYILHIVILSLTGVFPAHVWGGEDLSLEPITVSGSRIPGPSTIGALTIITGEEIREAPAETLNEIIDLLGGIDLKRRGAGEIQGDLSIRGSSFEQVLVLVDGVPLNDPQTAHHDLDIPFFLTEVEQIEILKGPGSSLYGTDALGGTIQIKTAAPADRLSIRGRLKGGIFSENGEYTWWGGHAGISAPFLHGGATVSVGGDSSAGYREGTDFQVLKISARVRQKFRDTPAELIGGYMDKEFGAQDFYSSYPSWEHTGTLFLRSRVHASAKENFRIKPTLSYRRHTDHFVLDRENPDFYENRHETNSITGSLESIISFTPAGNLAAVLEGNGDRLDSDQLGDHTQATAALGVEYQTPETFCLTVNPSLRTDFHSRLGLIFAPSLGIGYSPVSNTHLRVSAGLSHRAPSFTELYYDSPANLGDPDLKKEQSFSVDGGATIEPRENISLSLAVFRRADWDLIDWARENPEDPWQAQNLGDITTSGAEFSSTVKFLRGIRIRGEYAYLSPQREETGYEFKYSQNYPAHRVTISSWGRPVWKISYFCGFDYQNRNARDDIFLFDLALTLSLSEWKIALVGKNLTDSEYEEIPGLIQPGRYLGTRIDFEWANR